MSSPYLALRYRVSLPRFFLARALGRRTPQRLLPLRLERLPEAPPPPGWLPARVRLAGICGSDLALLYGKSSPALSPFFSFPCVLGHEVLAEVEGQRVVANPVLGCRERALPPCAACARGDEGLCRNAAEGSLAPGLLGYCRDAPGGWSERLHLPPGRFLPVPDDVPDERAVLAEPLAVVLRGLRLAGEGGWPAEALVIGAGSIGLLAVRALQLLGFPGKIRIAARHPAQAELARQLGADAVYPAAAAAQRKAGAMEYRGLLRRRAWRGGVPLVVEASGSGGGLEEASWAVGEGGTLLLLGAPAFHLHDFSPYWFRELRLVGSYACGAADFRRAVAALPELPGLERLVTHTFPLEQWRAALRTAVTRRGIKVAFRPG